MRTRRGCPPHPDGSPLVTNRGRWGGRTFNEHSLQHLLSALGSSDRRTDTRVSQNLLVVAPSASSLSLQATRRTRAKKMELQQGFCIWLTGLPSAGKTTIAREVERRLRERGVHTELLDGDEVRRGLSSDLGFDRKSREMHASRVTFVARVLARNNVVPLVALISPYRQSRALARKEIGAFVEVYVSTPLNVCEERDVKGLYRKARMGEIHDMTGVDDPYEPPVSPEIVVDTLGQNPGESAEFLLAELVRLKWLPDSFSKSMASGAPARDRLKVHV